MYMLSFLLCVYGLYYWMGWILMMYMLTVYICVLYLSLSLFLFLFSCSVDSIKNEKFVNLRFWLWTRNLFMVGLWDLLCFWDLVWAPFFGNGVFSSRWLMEKIRKSSKFARNIILWKKMYFGRLRLGKS